MIGEIVAELVVDGTTHLDISILSPTRFAEAAVV